jgi:hypothetical protein
LYEAQLLTFFIQALFEKTKPERQDIHEPYELYEAQLLIFFIQALFDKEKPERQDMHEP